jgi:mRNA interferase RelE/StbE
LNARQKRILPGFPLGFMTVIGAIQALARNPRPPGCRKLAGSKNDWRIRVSDYRVVYEVADEIRIVRVNRVRHRREVYR